MNTPPPSNRAEGLLIAALDHAPDDREAFLVTACGDDAALLAEVRSLLAAHEAMPSGFLAQPAINDLAGSDLDVTIKAALGTMPSHRVLPPSEKSGDRIGPYKLLQEIGEGGFGTVWMADQEQPVRRRVALKIIKLGMDTKEVVARFEQERQALAMMDHPNIARVFDAGATEQGRPFFVMELVRGMKITDYCDEKGLSTVERVELFILVCQAVQHAHQKGIIHRDLKPSNILVTVNDGRAVPKVIDFGVAKATQGKLSDGTLFTQFEQMIGTPLYMSPEQAEMTSVDVDTRSDIYSLGVLLYELLTGRTPIDMATMAKAGMGEIRRLIREVDPPRPSMRLKTLDGNELTSMAKRRHTEPTKLPGALRGDIDWIVMKCLEKDRGRRYDTANGLALDLQRHLSNEVVIARPPTTAYLLSKLIRRNKVAFAAGTAIAASLVIGITLSVWQAVRATQAKKEAVTAFDELRATAPAFAEQARGLAAKEQYADAITKLDYAIKLRPDAAEFLVAKGDLLQCQLRLAEAAAIYREALRVQPGQARAEASAKLCDELLAAPLKADGKLTLESLGKLHLAMQKQQRPAAELMPTARLLGREKEIMLAFWLERLKDLPISADKPLKDRLTVRDDGLLELDLKGAKINDLAPLAGMPLGSLTLWNCKDIVDFTPLRDFRQLTYLDLDNTQIRDLAPLQGLPLEVLYLGNTGVSELSPLRGMRLKTLEIQSTRVSELDPLKGMPLVEFGASTISVTDFSALKGAPLEDFHLDTSLVRDLSFLADAPVKVLYLHQCHELRGLAFLAKMMSLERLVLPQSYRTLPDEELAAIGALQTHPRLQCIQADPATSRSGTDRMMMSRATQPKDIFWKAWDREQNFLQALRKTGLTFELTKLPEGTTYRLRIEKQPLDDLSFLKDAPISELSLPECKVADLSPIRNLPLRSLQLSGNPVTDLKPLRDMPLEELRLQRAPVSDLTPLGRLPLKELYLDGCANITDVAAIAGITTLKMLTVPPQARHIEALRELTGMQMLAFEANGDSKWRPNSTAKAFWEAWGRLAWMQKLNDAGVLYTATEIVEGMPEIAAPKGSSGGQSKGKKTQSKQAAAKPVGKPTGLWSVTVKSKEFGDCGIFKGVAIRELTLQDTSVSDLRPLEGLALTKLNVQKTSVTDLTPLRGMPLRELNIHGTIVTDLTALRGMQLQSLILGETPVTDLSPLHGMPLAKLHMSGTQVADLSALRGMPLVEIRMPWCPRINDLSPLAQCRTLTFITLPRNAWGIEFLQSFTTLRRISYTENFKENSKTYQPDKTAVQFWKEYADAGWRTALHKAGIVPKVMKELNNGTWEVDLEKSGITELKVLSGAAISILRLGNTEVSDLTPLRGMALTYIALFNTKVTDLGPLQGMPLDNLHVSGTAVDDISVLRGMPLRRVRLHACRNLTDISPLACCTELTDLTLPPNAKDFEFLRDSRAFPKLERLSFIENKTTSLPERTRLPDKTAAEFWKEHDAKQKP